MFAIPKKGLVVRDPLTMTPLPEGGAEVPDSFYWHRRLRDGDITIGAAPKAAPVDGGAKK